MKIARVVTLGRYGPYEVHLVCGHVKTVRGYPMGDGSHCSECPTAAERRRAIKILGLPDVRTAGSGEDPLPAVQLLVDTTTCEGRSIQRMIEDAPRYRAIPRGLVPKRKVKL